MTTKWIERKQYKYIDLAYEQNYYDQNHLIKEFKSILGCAPSQFGGKDLNGGKPWDDKWIHIDGRILSPNDIENKIIRPQFNKPRIHFAANCAAQSCPPIVNSAYSVGNLNTNMEKATKAFINNTIYNTITKNKVVASKIFDWYKADFGNLITFLNKYSDTKIDPNATVEYIDYDWGLNDK